MHFTRATVLCLQNGKIVQEIFSTAASRRSLSSVASRKAG
jgi:hypothetical protein